MTKYLSSGWSGRRIALIAFLLLVAVAALLVIPPSLADPAAVADKKLMSRLQAHLGAIPGRPDLPAPGSSEAYLPREDLLVYWRHLGFTKAADDNDATWAYQIARDHPDPAMRRWIVGHSYKFLSEGRLGEGLRSELSEFWRGEVIKLISEFAASRELKDRLAALKAIGVGRLWRFKPLDQVYEGFGSETDPQARQNWLTSQPEFLAWKASELKGG